MASIGNNHDTDKEMGVRMRELQDKYFKWLPLDEKKKAEDTSKALKTALEDGSIHYKSPSGYTNAKNITEYWKLVAEDNKNLYSYQTKMLNIFEKNGKRIKEKNLGGLTSNKSKEFNKDLQEIRSIQVDLYKRKKDFTSDQVNKSRGMDLYIKTNPDTMKELFERNILR